jgi:hypothetical protein
MCAISEGDRKGRYPRADMICIVPLKLLSDRQHCGQRVGETVSRATGSGREMGSSSYLGDFNEALDDDSSLFGVGRQDDLRGYPIYALNALTDASALPVPANETRSVTRYVRTLS